MSYALRLGAFARSRTPVRTRVVGAHSSFTVNRVPRRTRRIRSDPGAVSVSKRWRMICSGCLLLVAAVRAQASDAWLDGDVALDLEVLGGERVFRFDEPVRLRFRVDHDAYIAVYALDTQGRARWLFPRFWEDDGRCSKDQVIVLENHGLPPGERDAGIVFVQAIASPRPFDWSTTGLRRGPDAGSQWMQNGEPLRVQGDPLAGFNEINRLLFPDWDVAVFVAATAIYHVGRWCEHPTYLCGVCAGRYRGYHAAWVQVRAEFDWVRERGRGYCRRVHQPQYVYCAERRALSHAAGGRRPVRAALRVEVPRRGATPPAPDSDARSGGRRIRQTKPTVSGGALVTEVALVRRAGHAVRQ
jgi:hypothetical protein